MKFPKIKGLKIISFDVKPKQPVVAQRASPKLPPVSVLSKKPLASVYVPDEEARTKTVKETRMASHAELVSLGDKLQHQENLNRLDTRLCFALAREDFGLKAQLLQQRREIQALCGEINADIPEKLLLTSALQSQKHSLELEMAKSQLQFLAKPTDIQLELRESLERELLRRIPGRREEQNKEKTRLRGLSNSEFLMAYRVCARQVYMQASMPDTSYESLLSFWRKWQTHTMEAENRFGDAWLWQYI